MSAWKLLIIEETICRFMGHRWVFLEANAYGKIFVCKRCARKWNTYTGLMDD